MADCASFHCGVPGSQSLGSPYGGNTCDGYFGDTACTPDCVTASLWPEAGPCGGSSYWWQPFQQDQNKFNNDFYAGTLKPVKFGSQGGGCCCGQSAAPGGGPGGDGLTIPPPPGSSDVDCSCDPDVGFTFRNIPWWVILAVVVLTLVHKK